MGVGLSNSPKLLWVCTWAMNLLVRTTYSFKVNGMCHCLAASVWTGVKDNRCSGTWVTHCSYSGIEADGTELSIVLDSARIFPNRANGLAV